MISTNFVPSQDRRLSADDTAKSFPAITEGQQNIPQANNATRHENADGTEGSHKLDSRDVAGCISLKRRLTGDTAPDDEMPQKAAKKDSTTSDGEPKSPVENSKRLSESEAFMMCFESQMAEITKKTKFKLELATLDKQIALEKKKLEITNLEERINRADIRKGNPMHTLSWALTDLLQGEAKIKQNSLKSEVNELTHLLEQNDWKKEFVMKNVRNVAINQLQQVPNAEKFTGGVERAVEEYLNKQSWDDL